MKYRILNNTPLEFFDTTATLVGSIAANGTNLKISSVNGIIELGNTATDIQVGTTGSAVNWSFMGGGTIGAAGVGTINLGQSGDNINMNVAGVNYLYPSTLVRYTDIQGTNNKIDISTQVPGTIRLTLPNKPVVGQLQLTDTIPSTSNATGALIVAGGVGIAGNVYSDRIFTNDLLVSGNISMTGVKAGYSSGRPGFRVYGSSVGTYSTTTNTTGYLNNGQWTVDFNQGSYLNNTTGVFTAPVAGLYQVNVVGRNAANTAFSQLAVMKNATGGNGSGGTVVAMIEWAGSSTMNHAGSASVLQMAVGDTLALKVLAGTINFDANDNWSLAYLG